MKKYKRTFSSGEVNLVQKWVGANCKRLLVKVYQDINDNGSTYEIKPLDMDSAIKITGKYYNDANTRKSCAELIGQLKNDEYICLYHVDIEKYGLTYEILRLAKG